MHTVASRWISSTYRKQFPNFGHIKTKNGEGRCRKLVSLHNPGVTEKNQAIFRITGSPVEMRTIHI